MGNYTIHAPRPRQNNLKAIIIPANALTGPPRKRGNHREREIMP